VGDSNGQGVAQRFRARWLVRIRHQDVKIELNALLLRTEPAAFGPIKMRSGRITRVASSRLL
jgi:hypothetical protein